MNVYVCWAEYGWKGRWSPFQWSRWYCLLARNKMNFFCIHSKPIVERNFNIKTQAVKKRALLASFTMSFNTETLNRKCFKHYIHEWRKNLLHSTHPHQRPTTPLRPLLFYQKPNSRYISYISLTYLVCIYTYMTAEGNPLTLVFSLNSSFAVYIRSRIYEKLYTFHSRFTAFLCLFYILLYLSLHSLSREKST